VKLGVHAPNFASLASPADLADLAARAEAAGWDGFFLWDHIARPEGTPAGRDGYDVVITGSDPGDCASWRKAGATWWLHELSWRAPLRESVAVIEAGPPSR